MLCQINIADVEIKLLLVKGTCHVTRVIREGGRFYCTEVSLTQVGLNPNAYSFMRFMS